MRGDVAVRVEVWGELRGRVGDAEEEVGGVVGGEGEGGASVDGRESGGGMGGDVARGETEVREGGCFAGGGGGGGGGLWGGGVVGHFGGFVGKVRNGWDGQQ